MRWSSEADRTHFVPGRQTLGVIEREGIRERAQRLLDEAGSLHLWEGGGGSDVRSDWTPD